MFEAYLPVSGRANESHSLSRVGWSHGIGRFQGLAVHPLRDEVSRDLMFIDYNECVIYHL